jgi:RNA polymerase sigma factor (sigma-70 family)
LEAETKALSIDELPRGMKALEASAFEGFAVVFGPRFRAYFLKRGLNASEAGDLAVTCVTDISLKVEQFSPRGPGSFEGWVFTLAHRALVDWFRSRSPTESLDEQAVPFGAFGTEASPNAAIVSAVEEALEQINETDRVIVSLRDMEHQWSFNEIAAHLDMSEGAVRVRHHRVLKRLEEILSQHPAIKPILQEQTQKGK